MAGPDAAKLAEVARLLRSSEALARSAVAALTGMAAMARTTVPERTNGTVEAGAPAAVTSSKAKRSRRKKKKDSEKEVMPFVSVERNMDVDSAVAATPTFSSSASPAPTRGSSSEPAAFGNAQTTPFYPVGSSVVIFGLATRKDLEGTIGRVLAASSPTDERVAVGLPSGEQVRVKHLNIKPSIFQANVS